MTEPLRSHDQFLDALGDANIDTIVGLRALLRLVSSYAALNALNWVLDEPTEYARTSHAVLDAASPFSSAQWSPSPSAGRQADAPAKLGAPVFGGTNV